MQHLLLATALLAALPAAATAAERQGRLRMTIEVEREASVRNGSDHARRSSRSLVQIATTLTSDGTLHSHNPLDPAAARAQLAQAQQVQQRVQQVQQAQRQHTQAMPGIAPAEMVARVQQMQALCGTDRDCLAREASKFSAAHVAASTGMDAAGQARLQAYGAAYRQCEARHPRGAAQRACIDAARRQAGGQPDATDHDDEPPEVFLTFIGQGDCRVETRLRVEDREEGALADVQGMVPFVTTQQVDAQPPSPMLCAGQQWVLDTATGTLWSHGSLGVGSARGQRVHTSGGRTERSEVDIDAGWHEAAPWIAEKLRRLPVQGEARHTLPVANGQGQVRVTMRWRFE